MRKLKRFNNRLVYSFAGGVLCLGIIKTFLYFTDRAQFEDSNLLVSLAFVLIVTLVIYLVLRILSASKSRKKLVIILCIVIGLVVIALAVDLIEYHNESANCYGENTFTHEIVPCSELPQQINSTN